MERTLEQCSAKVRDHLEEKPYQALAVAVGVGFVLGAGLWRHLARSLVNVGGRLAVTAVVASIADSILPIAEQPVGGETEPRRP